ncbi:hotdog fold domain-containing protein [Streptomyces sp. NPDC086554]|uniref:PaaI family thioesterase n=1 Tax=Streptomyces sp. NPDC086554 TaxID=3154864 RepID=UPI003447BCEF
MTASPILSVPTHATGYPGVAFGGYVAGLLAARAEAKTVRVDFRGAVRPDTPLQVTQAPDGGCLLGDAENGTLVACAPAELLLDPPKMPTWEQARAATEDYLGYIRKFPPPIPDCFGCSPVPAGRGVRVFSSLVPGRELLAAAWVPDAELALDDGTLAPEMVWSTLDCPGGWAGIRLGLMRPGSVTAALTGTQLRPVRAGERHVSYAWPIAAEGRKVTVGVALATAEGELCALAEALWISPRERGDAAPAPGT